LIAVALHEHGLPTHEKGVEKSTPFFRFYPFRQVGSDRSIKSPSLRDQVGSPDRLKMRCKIGTQGVVLGKSMNNVLKKD
jgi:hypothetical protein